MNKCNCSPFHVCYECQEDKDDRDMMTIGEIVTVKVTLSDYVNTLSEQELKHKLINLMYDAYIQDIRSGFATYDIVMKELKDE